MPGELITQDEQYELRGLLFGAGTPYEVLQVEGLSIPGLRTSDLELVGRHGAVFGDDLLTHRQVVWTIDIEGMGPLAQARLDALAQAFAPITDTVPLVFQLPGWGKLRIECRPRRLEHVRGLDASMGLHQALAAVDASDPRIHSDAEISTEITIPDGQSSSTGTVTNAGTFATEPTLEIAGPCTNPRITAGGRTTALDLPIASGQTLVIDVVRRNVTLGGIDRYDAVRTDSRWIELPPGGNTVTYQRAGTSNTSTLTVRHRHAYLGV